MGKAIIIPSASWAQKNLGRVTFVQPDMLFISGEGTINGESVYTAMIGGSAVNAQWSINDASLAELSANEGESITLTPLTSGDIILTASYEGKTATRSITMSVEQPETYLERYVLADIPEEDVRYSGTTAAGRTTIYFPFCLDNAEKWKLNLSVAEGAPIKVGVQLHSEKYVVSTSTSSPTATNTRKSCWDSGWITAGKSVECDETKNKSNTIGGADNVSRPSYVCLCVTYASGSGFPTLEEIKQNITAELQILEYRKEKVYTQEDIDPNDFSILKTSAGQTRTSIYLDLQKHSNFNMVLNVASGSPIKVGVQYHDSRGAVAGATSIVDTTTTSWDSGWMTAGKSVECDETRNKYNTVGGATSANRPTYIVLAVTYSNDNTGTPTYEEIMQYITYTLTLEAYEND